MTFHITADLRSQLNCLVRQHLCMDQQIKVVIGFLVLNGAIIAGAWELMRLLLHS